MQPQFTAWQGGPHARVACVSCHIGEGAAGFVHAKLSGVRQLVHVVTELRSEADPAWRRDAAGRAGADLPRLSPAGARSRGDRIRVIREYADDEANTETMTVLQMHLGGRRPSGARFTGTPIPPIRVEYIATDATSGRRSPTSR